MTFEETDVALRKAASSLPVSTAKAKAPGGGPLNQICSVYAAIKPILQAISSIPFFPKHWKKLIEDLFAVMDKLCPSTSTAKSAAGASFEEVDKQVKAALAAHWTTPPKALTASKSLPDLGDILKQFCAIYKAIKPLLEFAKLFVPAAWKAAIIAFETVADQICSGGSPG